MTLGGRPGGRKKERRNEAGAGGLVVNSGKCGGLRSFDVRHALVELINRVLTV
jgi:hypothetical protein